MAICRRGWTGQAVSRAVRSIEVVPGTVWWCVHGWVIEVIRRRHTASTATAAGRGRDIRCFRRRHPRWCRHRQRNKFTLQLRLFSVNMLQKQFIYSYLSVRYYISDTMVKHAVKREIFNKQRKKIKLKLSRRFWRRTVDRFAFTKKVHLSRCDLDLCLFDLNM